MKKFTLDIKYEDGSTDIWMYDNFDNHVVSKRFGDLNPNQNSNYAIQPIFNEHDKVYKYLPNLKWLEINLGLQCNLDCKICPQAKYRNLVHSASPKDIPGFIEQLKKAVDNGLNPQFIKFWGGEPLTHWKTIKPLVPLVKQLLPNATYSIATNGLLLTKEMVDFFHEWNFNLKISCDGHYGLNNKEQNILDDPEKLELIKYARKLMGDHVSMMPVISNQCQRLDKIAEYFDEKLETKNIPCAIVVLKWNDTNKDILTDFDEATKKNIEEGMYYNMLTRHKTTLHSHMFNNFLNRVRNRDVIYSLSPHCENQERGIIVDLKGNVFDCKMRVERNGTLDNLNEIPSSNKIHFLYRKDCPNCPVVQICGGGCVRQKNGPEHEMTCRNSYYPTNLGQFRAAFKLLFNVEITNIREYDESEFKC